MTDKRLTRAVPGPVATDSRACQPAWFTTLARGLLAGATLLVAIAVLLPSIQLAALRSRYPGFGNAISHVEALWPAVDMVHVIMFASVGLLIGPAFPAWPFRRLLLTISVLACMSEFVQIWVPGRTAKISEVLLDIASGALAILLASGLRKAFEHRRTRRHATAPSS